MYFSNFFTFLLPPYRVETPKTSDNSKYKAAPHLLNETLERESRLKNARATSQQREKTAVLVVKNIEI